MAKILYSEVLTRPGKYRTYALPVSERPIVAIYLFAKDTVMLILSSKKATQCDSFPSSHEMTLSALEEPN